jgi:hypothetical protein
MVQLTEQAALELQALKDANGMQSGQGIRLIPNAGTVDIEAGEPVEGDEVIHRGGEPLLIVDSRLTESLRDLTFDCEDVEVDGQIEQRFTLRAA